jgi:hypothetical protein
VAADILIAASLCIALSRSRTGFKKCCCQFLYLILHETDDSCSRTESAINVMMMYTINTSAFHISFKVLRLIANL